VDFLLRVSTDQQGAPGLGLEVQRKAVLDYLNGGRWQLAAEFVEMESGSRRPSSSSPSSTGSPATSISSAASWKPVWSSSPATCRTANKVTIHILAAVAEHEREAISARTRRAPILGEAISVGGVGCASSCGPRAKRVEA
jgi:hypothetical protein